MELKTKSAHIIAVIVGSAALAGGRQWL